MIIFYAALREIDLRPLGVWPHNVLYTYNDLAESRGSKAVQRKPLRKLLRRRTRQSQQPQPEPRS